MSGAPEDDAHIIVDNMENCIGFIGAELGTPNVTATESEGEGDGTQE